MKEHMTKLEASKHGLVKGGNYLPEDFEEENEIDSYRFWLMAKLNNPTSEVLQKRHDWTLSNLRERLLDAYPSKKLADDKVSFITKQAYFTIPSLFWDNVERKTALTS